MRLPRSAPAITDNEPPAENERIVHARPPLPHPVYWVIATALVVIAVSLAARPGGLPTDSVAMGQPVMSGGARGIFAFSGQLAKGSHGIFMVDVDAMTLWAYEYQAQKGCLRLVAARTWRYDRYLENYNTCNLPPDVVENMVEQQRQFRLQSSEEREP